MDKNCKNERNGMNIFGALAILAALTAAVLGIISLVRFVLKTGEVRETGLEDEQLPEDDLTTDTLDADKD